MRNPMSTHSYQEAEGTFTKCRDRGMNTAMSDGLDLIETYPQAGISENYADSVRVSTSRKLILSGSW
jgi:hypothetical protein